MIVGLFREGTLAWLGIQETSKTALPFQGLHLVHFKTLSSSTGEHNDGKMCLPRLQRKHNSCKSRRNSLHAVREALHTALERPEESGTRLWSEGLRQACDAKSGLTESKRCIRRTICTEPTSPLWTVVSAEASEQALSSTEETGRAGNMPGR